VKIAILRKGVQSGKKAGFDGIESYAVEGNSLKEALWAPY